MTQTRHLVLGLMPRGADPDTHWAAGPWCFDTEEDFFPGWEDSFVFGREPLRDPATLDRAVLMAQSLTVDSIPALGRHLLDLQRRRAEENNPVSTLLQALAANVPTIAYWDRSIWPMTDEALARLDLLAEAGIWQPSAEAAAAKVREVWDNPARWWLDERVQSARRAFCREHAFVDPKGPDAHIVSLLQRL